MASPASVPVSDGSESARIAGLSPLWLLDVDGVLNAVVADVPHLYERLRAEAGGRGWNITYDPAIIKRIADLHTSGRVEVRWLTTWCQDAATSLAPAIGLPPFVVEGIPEFHGSHAKGWWKSPAAKRLSDTEPGRALIWTDDDLDYSERVGDVPWLAQRTGPTLALAPNPRTGLTADNLDRIEAFVTRIREAAA